ncbi:hypothetical protein Theco_2782 [Thermobacillus composti KWC4]|uniref:Uncharacterized protein n=1 Tax=Thermobacillus composti (strain DSM 18247 / JCM 13945 / KWC4) TaxID=717605 RepID=L0EGR5_THECK|nr:hypothetical protein Theco_2782 [Thermobacillus composti KWC4]
MKAMVRSAEPCAVRKQRMTKSRLIDRLFCRAYTISVDMSVRYDPDDIQIR